MVDHNLQHLMHLLKNRQVMASFQYLNSLSPATQIPNKAKLSNELKIKIEQAQGLTADINIMLAKGQYPKALQQLKKAQTLVPDFPNIQTDIDFITASISTMNKNLQNAQTLAAKGKRHQVAEILTAAQKIDRNNPAIPAVEKSLRHGLRKKKGVAVCITTLALILPLIYISFEQMTLLQAKDLWSKADQFIVSKQYQQAQAIIAEMDTRLQYVHLCGQKEKVRLLTIAADITQSEQFIYGLQGVPAPRLKPLNEKKNGNERHIEGLLIQAAALEGQNLPEALALYDKALQFSTGNIHISETTRKQIIAKIQSTREAIATEKRTEDVALFQSLLQQAAAFTATESWKQAENAYLQALTFAKKEQLQNYNEIAQAKKGYNQSIIRGRIENGEVAFNQNRYADAIDDYRASLLFLEENQVVEPELASIVRKQLLVVLVTEALQHGDQCYNDRKYGQSINKYNEALVLLVKSNQQLFAEESSEYQKEIQRKITQAEKQMLELSQRDHLLASYQKILRSNFNLSRNTVFKNPVIVLLAKKGDHLIYKVSALGSKSTAAANIRYELDYTFNLKTGVWNINDIPLGV